MMMMVMMGNERNPFECEAKNIKKNYNKTTHFHTSLSLVKVASAFDIRHRHKQHTERTQRTRKNGILYFCN